MGFGYPFNEASYRCVACVKMADTSFNCDSNCDVTVIKKNNIGDSYVRAIITLKD